MNILSLRVLSEEKYLGILAPGVSKGVPCWSYAVHCRFHFRGPTAFGDNLNELEMIRVAGTGKAMDRALEHMRMVADSVLPDLVPLLSDLVLSTAHEEIGA